MAAAGPDHPAPPPRLSRGRDAVGLAVSLGAALTVSAIGGAITRPAVATWYQEIQRPAITPPDWVFAPVWITLYVLMAVAAWRVWRRHGLEGARPALGLYGVQLALNLAWSFIFFGAGAFGAALAEIALLLAAIAATGLAFWRLDRAAGWLLAPYGLWVAYATAINAGVWWLNPV